MSRTPTRRAGAQAAVIATLTEDGARHDHLLGPRISGVVWLVGALTDHRGPAWGRRADPARPISSIVGSPKARSASRTTATPRAPEALHGGRLRASKGRKQGPARPSTDAPATKMQRSSV